MGASTRAMNMITAFWNAHVQGLDRSVRAFQERPMATATKVAASITLPSVMLWWANHDDPRWKEIPRWQKDLFWIVMTKDHVYRIPKPGEMGVLFGSLPERTLEAYFAENPKAFNDFSETLTKGLIPEYLPTFATPIIEQFANRSTFTGAPIIPASMEGLLPEYQYTEYTTQSGRMLGKLVAAIPGGKRSAFASPAVLENYISAWSGNLGRYALQLADKALTMSGAVPDPVKPASALADIPFVKAFVIRYPSSTAQSIQDFYDRNAQSRQVIDTIRHLAKGGDFQVMQREIKLGESQNQLISLDEVQRALSTQKKYIWDVYKNKQLTPDEKRQQIDYVYYGMIETAKAGNKILDQLEKAVER